MTVHFIQFTMVFFEISRHISSHVTFIKKCSVLKFFSIKFPIEWAINEVSTIILKTFKKWHFIFFLIRQRMVLPVLKHLGGSRGYRTVEITKVEWKEKQSYPFSRDWRGIKPHPLGSIYQEMLQPVSCLLYTSPSPRD